MMQDGLIVAVDSTYMAPHTGNSPLLHGGTQVDPGCRPKVLIAVGTFATTSTNGTAVR